KRSFSLQLAVSGALTLEAPGTARVLWPGTGNLPSSPPGTEGKPGRTRLLMVVSGRYLETYVNGRAVADLVLLDAEVTAPQAALRGVGQGGGEATAEFERVTVRPAGSLPSLQARGAVPKGP